MTHSFDLPLFMVLWNPELKHTHTHTNFLTLIKSNLGFISFISFAFSFSLQIAICTSRLYKYPFIFFVASFLFLFSFFITFPCISLWLLCSFIFFPLKFQISLGCFFFSNMHKMCGTRQGPSPFFPGLKESSTQTLGEKP